MRGLEIGMRDHTALEEMCFDTEPRRVGAGFARKEGLSVRPVSEDSPCPACGGPAVHCLSAASRWPPAGHQDHADSLLMCHNTCQTIHVMLQRLRKFCF